MRALASFSVLSGQRTVAGTDLTKLIGKIGLIESRHGGKTFAQLYAGIALRSFGSDLRTNTLWLGLTAGEQTAWRSLLVPTRFFDPGARPVIYFSEEYFFVAARGVTVCS